MQRSWAAFARAGAPSHDGFAWRAFDPVPRTTTAIDVAPRVFSPAFEDQVRVLAPVFEKAGGPTYLPRIPSNMQSGLLGLHATARAKFAS